jgi:hypothetical protein
MPAASVSKARIPRKKYGVKQIYQIVDETEQYKGRKGADWLGLEAIVNEY